MTNKKIVLYTSIALLVTGVALFFYNKSKEVGISSNAAFNDLIKNLGGAIKPNSNGVVVVPFNSNKNIAEFFNNGRVSIFDSTKKLLKKGSYSNGGLTITIDGAQPMTTGSVWSNLIKTL